MSKYASVECSVTSAIYDTSDVVSSVDRTVATDCGWTAETGLIE